MAKKILICGATGFIGKNLVKFFEKKNYKVFATYNKKKKFKTKNNVKWVKGDLKNYSFCKKITKDIDILIQAAATTSGAKNIVERPFIHVTDNAIMNSYILKSAYENKVKHVLFTSCTVMYHQSKKPLKESDYNSNKEISKKYYGAGNTKIYIEKMCKFFSDISKTKFTIIRHSNIYGPNDKFNLTTSHFVGATIYKVFNKSRNFLEVWGNGQEVRNLLYINDLINFINLAINKQSKKFLILNCGYPKAFKIIEIVKKIIKASNRKILIKFNKNKPTIPFNINISSNKALNEIGWKSKTNIDDGLKKTIKWYLENYKIKNFK